ncbi:MAG: hypothetical protein Q9226_003588 [Calogaya cf. arnoldii]
MLRLAIWLLAAQFVTLSNSKECKPLINSSQWPSPKIWKSLNDSLSGNLLAPSPPAVVCDPLKPKSFDRALCAQVGASWSNSRFHTNDPVSVTYPNWQSEACLPTTLLLNTTATCNLYPFPKYVVYASSVVHVAVAVKFASRTGIDGTFFHVHLDSTYLGALTVASGHRMGEIYAEASRYNATIVGAADPNVGLGGFLTGGGHSPIGSNYGLGVDNVLEITVVTPDGVLKRANACQHPDIFWAVRGGGAFTFGVLISATLKTHPIPPITGALLSFNSTSSEASGNNNTNFYSVTAYLHTQLPYLSAAGLTGYYSIIPLSASPISAPASTMNFAFLIYTLSPNTTKIMHTLAPIMARLNKTSGLTSVLSIEPPTDFLYFQFVHFRAAPVGENYLPGTRLWDTKAVADPTSLENALRQFQNHHLQGTFVSGAGVQSVPPDESAVNPARKRTVVDMSS